MSKVTPKDILLKSNMPPVVHEIVAILRFDTSYELVDWLAKWLQLGSDQVVQEHKDREMIQCTLLGEIEPEDEHELNRIRRHKDVRNKGMAIQIPPLQTTLSCLSAPDRSVSRVGTAEVLD